MKHLLRILLIILPLFLNAQTDKMKVFDAFNELDNNELSLLFTDALTGKFVKDGSVTIKKIGEFTTNYQGQVFFPIPEKDDFYLVHFAKDGYISSTFKIDSPVMPLEKVRIVLDWGKYPADLDAHLLKNGQYHISYRNKRVSDDGEANLDIDDTSGFGPETITINSVDDNAVYSFFVHDYSDKNNKSTKKLSDSKASIKIYGQGKLLQKIDILQNEKGNYWNVFKIKQGNIEPFNQLSGKPFNN